MGFLTDGSVHRRDRNLVFSPKGASGIQFVGIAPSPNNTLATISVPSHRPNDLVMVLERGNVNNGAGPLRPGYTSFAEFATPNNPGWRLQGIIDTDNTITTIAGVADSGGRFVFVLRNASIVPGLVNQIGETDGASNPLPWPDLLPGLTDGSWVICIQSIVNTGSAVSSNPGLIERALSPVAWGGAPLRLFDTAGVAGSWSGRTYTMTAPNFRHKSQAVEIRSA